MSNSKTLILIDGHALAFRQYFALERTGMKTSDGVLTWAVYGFFKAIFDLLKNKKIKPDSIAVTFDVGRQTFRVEKYEQYKAQREAMPDALRTQLGLIVEGLKAFNIPIYTKEGFEADDVIGTITKKASEQGHKTLILTGDQDAFQLIDKEGFVKVLIPSKGELKEYDWTAVYEKLGVYPNQITDYKGLRGDTSDNIPGVRGIGEKTAQKLLSRYPNLEAVLEDCENIKEKAVSKNLCENRETAVLSKYLATIVRDVDIDFDFNSTKIELPNINDAVEYLKKLQFYSFIKNIDDILCSFNKDCEPINDKSANNQQIQLIPTMSESDTMQLGLFSNVIKETMDSAVFEKKIMTGENEINELIEILEKQKEISIIIKADYSNAVVSNIDSFAIAYDDKGIKTFYLKASDNEILKFKKIFENENIKKFVYDAKNNINFLKQKNINLKGIAFDVMLASYVKNPSRNHELSAQALDYLNHIMADAHYDSKKRGSISDIDFDLLAEWSMDEVYSIFKMTEFWKTSLSKKELNLLDDVELPLSIVLAKMEYDGVTLDVRYLNELSMYMEEKLKDLENKVYELAGQEFNLNSPRQVGDILYNKLNIVSKKKTKGKTSLSTSVEVLEELSQDNEICKYLILHRKYAKLKSTYTDSLPLLIDGKDKKIHTTYNQTITTTGRLSSSNPNLQNIPIRTEEGNKLRQAFIPSKSGNFILSSDYSQIELRLLAHISKDENLISAFNSGVDVHTLTASKVFGVPVEEVTREMRYKSKAVNFGIIYGQSRYGLAKAINISANEAQIFIDKYFETYPRVKTYMENTVRFAYENGYVETMFGRRRYLANELAANNRNLKEFAERAAINQPLQGSAADLIKMAMIKVDEEFANQNINSKMVMQVHDELVFDVEAQELEKVQNIVRNSMEKVCDLSVPLTVDISWGDTWKE